MNDTSPHLGALLGVDCVDVVVVVVTFSVCSNLQQTPTFLVFGRRQIVGKYPQKKFFTLEISTDSHHHLYIGSI